MRPDLDTKLIFLLGDPLRQSVAARVYNRWFERAERDILYIPVEVRSEDELRRILAAVRVLPFAGLGVTKPYKVGIMNYLDEAESVTAAIGSANTVLIRDGRWIGYNTDGVGALRSLRGDGFEPAGREIFCYGAGGTARSVCFTLAAAGAARITLTSRSDSCESLAREINAHFPGVCAAIRAGETDKVRAAAARCPLVMNLSGVGMGRTLGESPADETVFAPGTLAFDAIYGPPKSRFLADAEARGARILNGFGMFTGQAARQLELWTGVQDAFGSVAEILREVLG